MRTQWTALYAKSRPVVTKKWYRGWRQTGPQRVYYRSRMEANYGAYLEFLRKRGEILAWEHEPETFWFPVKRGCVSYLPDFRVRTAKGIEYHEVKGWMDPKSKTKLRRMARFHPAVKLVLIDTKAYRALKRTVAPLIEGWE